MADRCRSVVGERERTVNPAGELVTQPSRPLPARSGSRKPSFVCNPHCYPHEPLGYLAEMAIEGVQAIDCRIASPETQEPVCTLLNEAWDRFWADPDNYHRWESDAVRVPLAHCQDGTADCGLPPLNRPGSGNESEVIYTTQQARLPNLNLSSPKLFEYLQP